jgi:hypothetical protein
LELSFLDKEIRAICEDEDKAILKYGVAISKVLQSRLADLLAIKTVHIVVSLLGNAAASKVSETPYSDFKVEIAEGLWLIFTSAHTRRPESNGDIDWSKVTRIKILKIEKIL